MGEFVVASELVLLAMEFACFEYSVPILFQGVFGREGRGTVAFVDFVAEVSGLSGCC